MSINTFHFKQFSINHELCAMKVGTDSVLLGAWAQVEEATRILDVGTGSGILALMAAQRNPDADILAIDIDEGAVRQTQENAEQSPWAQRIQTDLQDIRHFPAEQTFDCILCNPPFYENGLASPSQQRNQARQTSCLPFPELIESCSRILSDNGIFCVIIPAESADFFIQTCWENNLNLKEKTWVRTKVNKAPKRVLLSFSKEKQPYPVSKTLCLKDEANQITEEYRTLTQDFYLSLK